MDTKTLIDDYLGCRSNKRRNAYGIIRDLAEMVSPQWLRYVHFNDERRCFQANPGYTHNEMLAKRYHLKLNKTRYYHGKERRTQRPGVSAA